MGGFLLYNSCMKKLITLTLCALSMMGLSGCTQYSDSAVLDTFSGITFNDASFVYDGTAKSIYVSGAPEFATVTYEGNEKINVGKYNVKAHITADKYVPLDLSAYLTITNASFGDITFESKTFEYDGEAHSIYVTGAPDFATVKYTNNNKTSVGTYTVTATISAANYSTVTKTATMTILGKDITGVTFNDQSFVYDGKSHSIEVSGELPTGVSVKYTNNGKVDSGTYKVTATLSGTGYNTLTLQANLIITPIELNNPGYFYDACFVYDGNDHSIVVTSAPKSATITYKCTNASGQNTFKNPGKYDIEATVSVDKNYASTLKATMFIVDEGIVGTDPSKEALKIDENLTWDELYDALSKDNFTQDYYDGCYDVESLDDPRPEDLLTYDFSEHQLRCHFVTDGKQAYSKNYSTYDEPYYSYDFYKEIGNDVLHLYFQESGKYTDIEKFPKEAFSETVCKVEASNAFAALEKGENGEFLLGLDRDDYYGDVGYPFIMDGKFVVLMEHSRPLSSGYRYFYRIYIFYNIGNSTVELPSRGYPSVDYVENHCGVADYRLGGVKYRWASYGSYNNLKSYYSAELYVSYRTKIFLKPGTYTVLPYIYDRPVMAIVHYSYYNQYYNYNQSGYTFNLYVNEDGYYQGEYEELGKLGRFDIRDFTSDGGSVNYYSDWHE